MKTKIENISDLQAERARLKNRIENSRVGIQRQFEDIKEEINPARQVMHAISGMIAKPDRGFVQLGVARGVDLLLRQTPIGRAAWPIRFIIPFVVKRVASNYVNKTDRTEVLIKSLRWVKRVTDEKPVDIVRVEAPKPSLKVRFLRWLKNATAEKPGVEWIETVRLDPEEYPSRVSL
ncbi:MAG: hypothetical protein QM669_12000 [Siphonobacter sp.]